jgi:hypothetical protein
MKETAFNELLNDAQTPQRAAEAQSCQALQEFVWADTALG